MTQEPRLTRTARYLLFDRGLDGVLAGSAVHEDLGQRREGRVFIPRLTFSITPKLDYDPQLLYEGFERDATETTFFADTSLFDGNTDRRLWDFLLSSRRLVLLPHVMGELVPWLERHPEHVAADAVVSRSDEIHFPSLDYGDQQLSVFGYYVNLLGMRKRVTRARTIAFESDHGRRPTPDELSALKRELQRQFGERGYLLALKGAERDARAPTFYTDEVVVFGAFDHALRTGRDTVILTKDEDFAEQFYKLQWMLDTHYRSMLLGRAYLDHPAAFPKHAIPEDSDLRDAFEGRDNVLIERSPDQIAELLPLEFEFVALHCLIVGDRLTECTFGAERGMATLLDVKARTRGLNTDLLDGRNVHLWLAPYDLPPELRGCAAVVHDRRVLFQQTGALVPIFDVNQTLYTGERFEKFVDHPGR